MRIASHDTSKNVFVIAEVGNNHEGSRQLAADLIGLAAKAGADAVKFQSIVPDRLVSASQTERIQQLKRICLPMEDFDYLAGVAKKENILFMSTPFDLDGVKKLEPLVPAYKISSGDNDFYALLDAVAATGKPLIVSSGMSEISDLEKTVFRVRKTWGEKGIKQEIGVLHCVSCYPVDPQDANLLAIREIEKLGVVPGYSDHTLGIEAAVLAVAVGARIVEKHFTIRKDYSSFRDHQLSADPKDLAEMVRRIREAQSVLGISKKIVGEKEKQSAKSMRRSIVAGRDLEKGAKVSAADLDWVRPGSGLRPGEENKVLGKKLSRAVARGEAFLPEHFAE